MLRALRKKTIKETEELDEILGKEWQKWYIEKHYKKNGLFKFLLYIRSKGANINKFLDSHLKNDTNE